MKQQYYSSALTHLIRYKKMLSKQINNLNARVLTTTRQATADRLEQEVAELESFRTDLEITIDAVRREVANQEHLTYLGIGVHGGEKDE